MKEKQKTFYAPKILDLTGYTAKRWDMMEVGEEYLCRISLPVMKRYYSGVNKGRSRKMWESYYLVSNPII